MQFDADAFRAIKIVALITLTTAIVVRGLVPSFSRIDADFPGYFTAAKIAMGGASADKLYDDDWFRQQIRRYGLESPENPGKFAPFPPPTALLLAPLAKLEPLTALRVVSVASVLCVLGSILLLARIASWTVLDSAVFVLLSGHAIINGLRFGQPYMLVSLCCILGYWAYMRGRPLLAGACFGLFAPIKYYPAVFIAYLALRRRWQVLWGGVFTILAVAALSVAVLGWPVHEIFLRSVLWRHLTGHLSLTASGPPFTAVYQSFDTLLNRLFRFDSKLNPHPVLTAPLIAEVGVLVAKISILLAAAAALVKLAGYGVRGIEPSIGILGILVLLIAPANATYHFALLWLPVALLVKYLLSCGERIGALIVVGTYSLIGLFPYELTSPYEGRGGLTLLAYPRLFLLLAMFAASVYFTSRPRSVEDRDAVAARETLAR